MSTERANGGSRRTLVTVYGLKNCDSTRKATRWLEDRGVAIRFRDVRDDVLSRDLLDSWLSSDFSASLLNRRSTTWRALSEARRAAALENPAEAILRYPTLLKRPVIVAAGKVASVGFSPDVLEPLCAA